MLVGETIRGLLELALPPTCFHCGTRVDQHHRLCNLCWSGLDFIADPKCTICGFPFEFAGAAGSECAACDSRKPNYDSARAALVYNDASRPLILSFKYSDRTEGANCLAGLMLPALRECTNTIDRIVPVPLYKRRLVKRRYNQALLLADALSAVTGIPVDRSSLIRKRHTPSQGGLGRRARFDNVRTAFAVVKVRRPLLEGASILLVDDVMTTGATVESSSRTLKRFGATAIHVLTLARVVAPRNLSI